MLGRGAGRRSYCWPEELGRGPDGELVEVDGGSDSFDWLRAPQGLSTVGAAASLRNRGRENCCAGENASSGGSVHFAWWQGSDAVCIFHMHVGLENIACCYSVGSNMHHACIDVRLGSD
jgi:hypothetical protein